jgi:hypothetical protein
MKEREKELAAILTICRLLGKEVSASQVEATLEESQDDAHRYLQASGQLPLDRP